MVADNDQRRTLTGGARELGERGVNHTMRGFCHGGFFGGDRMNLVPTVRYFAVFCALMVAVNFVLVCTLYLAGLVLWDRHLRFCSCVGRGLRGCRPKRAAGEAPDRGEGGGDDGGEDGGERGGAEGGDDDGAAASGTPVPSSTRGVSLVHRRLHAFASVTGRVVVAHRLKVIAVFGVLAAAMLGFAVTIGDPGIQRANPYWEYDTPLGRRWDLEAFALRNVSRDSGIDLSLVMGIDTIDRTGTDPTDDSDLGVPVFHPGFDYAQPASQEYVLWLCAEMEREAPKKKIEPFANNCNYRRRPAALHRGSAARLPACVLTLRACWPPRQVLARPSQVRANPSQVPAAHRRERRLLPPRLRVPRGQHRLQAGLLALALTLTPNS